MTLLPFDRIPEHRRPDDRQIDPCDAAITAPGAEAATSPQASPAVSWPAWLRPVVIERLMVAADALLIMACGVASGIIYNWLTAGNVGKIDVYTAASLLIAFNFVLLVNLQHGYQLRNIANPYRQLRVTFFTWSGVFAAFLALAFTLKVSDEFSRATTMLFFTSGLAALCGWKVAVSRWTAHALRAGAFTNSRIVVISEQGLAANSTPLLELRQLGYRPMHTLEISAGELASPLLMSSINERFQALMAYARENRIEHVFLLLNWSRQHAIDSLLDALKVLPVPVHLIPDAHVARFLRFPMANAGGAWTAELRRAPLGLRERALKRGFDLAGASLALLIFSPIMLAAAILVKCTSKGPILFRQTRNGFNGRAFRIYKFRTMRVNEDGPSVVQATRNDPRVTALGRWLRKTSIDELPQLFNVLGSEMSLVGPRPHAAAHNSQYEQIIGNYAFRHHVKPGITGWAQINGYRGETNEVGLMEKRVEMDLWYINNWSVWLDGRIIIKTALMGIRDNRAY